MPVTKDSTGPSPVNPRVDILDLLGPEWREVALEHYFRRFTLSLGDSSRQVTSTHKFGGCLIPVESEHAAVKAVKVCLSLGDLVNGKAAHMLAQSEYSSLVYSSAKTLRLDINELYDSGWYFEAGTGVLSFYQQMVKMFPMVSRVQVLTNSNDTARIGNTECEFEQRLVDLHAKYHEVCTTIDYRGDLHGNLAGMHASITEMRLDSNDYSLEVALLIRECAETLELLEMSAYSRHDVCNVLLDSHGRPIEYPRLVSLSLNTGFDSRNSTFDACSQLLLPSLTHLTIEREYPFKDDVIFRCTSTTLVYANLSVCYAFTEILRKHQVFLEPIYPKLRRVEISYGIEAGRGTEIQRSTRSSIYWSYVYSIAPKFRGLSIRQSFDIHTFLEMVTKGPALSNIRCLKLKSTSLTFDTFCNLVEKLPNMSQLLISSLWLNTEYEKWSHAELHDHFASKWNPLSLCLQSCDIDNSGYIDMNATYALLLVAICPRITRFMANNAASTAFQIVINKEIEKEPFSRYTDRLKSLTFNGIAEGSGEFAAFKEQRTV